MINLFISVIFSGYNYTADNIKLICRLARDRYQELIPISTIQEFPELKTLEWNILNPDLLINLEINNKRRTSNIYS